jgi:hypothetical protein
MVKEGAESSNAERATPSEATEEVLPSDVQTAPSEHIPHEIKSAIAEGDSTTSPHAASEVGSDTIVVDLNVWRLRNG